MSFRTSRSDTQGASHVEPLFRLFGGKQDADHKPQGSGRTGNTSGGNDFAPGTQVSYDPNLITRFLGHHESLWKQYGAIAAGAAVPDYPAVMDSMQRFQRVLNEHLLEENLRLYTYLSKCLASDADSAALNNHMRQEMSDIGRAVTQFLRQYLASGVDDSNIVEFRSQLQEIGGVLKDRIEREENSLYTLSLPVANY